MKKALFTLICLFAMIAAGTSIKAQEITISLDPGWNWISYPNTEVMTITAALGDFTPMQGDVIKSKGNGQSVYNNGAWRGKLTYLIPGSGYHYYSARTEYVEFVFAQAASSNVTTAEPTNITNTSAVVGGTVTVPEGGHVFLRGVCWGTEPNPDIDGNHTSEETGVGAFSSTIEGLTTGLIYYVRAYAVIDNGLVYGENLSFVANYEYVDLGLPSGLLWATCNVGADAPEGYGDYFAWGETQPKSEYSENTYLFYNDGILTKYTGSDGLTVLLPEDDAATANWGGDWRMPTKEECQELFYNTTCTWTTQNGVVGQLFTATNGNSLFMPAVGYRNWSDLYGENNIGYYWTSSLFTDNPHDAWNYYVDSYSNGKSYSYRCYGYTVRPVRSSGQSSVEINVTANPTEGGWVSGGGTYQAGDICTLNAMAYDGYVFVNWLLNGDVVSTEATYSFTVSTSMNLVASFGVYSVGDYVDLGLPSGLLWATCNVGAETSEGWGNYYAWGETQPKETYSWNTYQHCNGSSSTLTKYTGSDGMTTLLPEDDAATANWGSEWRMPTYDEWNELSDNTTKTWITQNGVYGILFTASNGNTLFMPCAGTSDWNSLYDLSGDYWSSSLNMTHPSYAKEANIDMSAVAYDEMDEGNRFRGIPVRAVRCKNSVINVSANSTVCGTVSGGGTFFDGTNCTVSATANEGYIFVGWSEDGLTISTETSYSFTVSGNRNLLAFFYNYISGAYQYVDLGLPSGLMWATCNVGAETPEGYGNYYAWAETQPKSTYTWNTYQYCHGSSTTFTKYCNKSYYGYNGFTDNLTTLLPEDDAATANWGADWRMPTRTEWSELYNNTVSTWATLNGVRGKLYTASNGNGIFLPTGGRYAGSYLSGVGISGHYWSSSLDDAPSRARDFTFGENSYLENYRYYGQSVRAVRSSR